MSTPGNTTDSASVSVPDASAETVLPVWNGGIESFGPKYVWGWVMWRDTPPSDFAVQCGGTLYHINLRWVVRPELGLDPATAPPQPGFEFVVPYELSLALLRSPALVKTITLIIGGKRVPFANGVSAVLPTPGDGQDLALETSLLLDGKRVAASIWSDQPFRLKCSVQHCTLPASEFRLLLGGALLEASTTAVSTLMTGAAKSSETPAFTTTYDIELPGVLWETVEEGGFSQLQFSLGGQVFPAEPVRLPVKQGQRWLEWQAEEGLQESYDQLLALEHMHFLVANFKPTAAVKQYYEEIARTYGMAGYASKKQAAGKHQEVLNAPVDLGAMLVWQALRDFNTQLPAFKDREGELLISIEEAWPKGASITGFFESVTPYFCRIGRFDLVRNKLPAAHIDAIAQFDASWSKSLALPFLVAEGAVERACDLVTSLAGKSGWIITECVAEASRILAVRACVDASAERFVYGLIGVLDSIAEDYWARTHDVQFIEAVVCWLDAPAHRSHWVRSDLINAILRIYGTSPVFWQRFERCPSVNDPLLDRLLVARDHFRTLSDILVSGPVSALDHDTLRTLRNEFVFFSRAGNLDVPRMLRELVCNRLVVHGGSQDELNVLPYQEFLALSTVEGVRAAALPMNNGEEVIARMPGLPQLLASMHRGDHRSPRHTLQTRLGRLIGEFALAVDSEGPAQLERLLARLLQDVRLFASWENHYLAADVLSRAVSLTGVANAGSVIINALGQDIVEGLTVQATHRWPSQPLLSAISRFRSSEAVSRNMIAQTYLRKIEQCLTGYPDEDYAILNKALKSPEKLKLEAPRDRDTLVVVYSCRRYLDTRIQAIRETWLKDLERRGIPHVILVGDGDDELHGDVLELNVSDRYEDLPAKTLAMVRWVAEYTNFQFLLKIDDDCLLNVDEYFDSMSYRKFHYYGRVIHRNVGSTDRRWHQNKSQGQRAMASIDKSPEPSMYADGGGSYTISRLAMLASIDQAATPWGARLVNSSFMEDKLLGDLLSWAGIWVAGEDYSSIIRRRFGDNARPVNVFDNTFLPSLVNPVKFAHLDLAADMQPVWDGMQRNELLPKKIWPSYAPPGIEADLNQLELLTSFDVAQRLLAEPLVVIGVFRNEMLMAGHFLTHYRRLGVKTFIIIDNLSDDGTREFLLQQPDVVLYSSDTQYRYSTYGVAWQQAILANHCMGKWALIADADELIVYPDQETTSLVDLAKRMETAGFDTACVQMVDMYPHGDLADADFTREEPFVAAPWFDANPVSEWRLTSGYYSNSVNHVSALRHRLMPSSEPHSFTSQKFCLIRYMPWMRFCAGLHNIANAKLAPDAFWFAHFKYHAGFKKKVEEEVQRKQHFNDAAEYRNYLGLLAESGGGFGDKEVSVQYTGPASFAVNSSGAKGHS